MFIAHNSSYNLLSPGSLYPWFHLILTTPRNIKSPCPWRRVVRLEFDVYTCCLNQFCASLPSLWVCIGVPCTGCPPPAYSCADIFFCLSCSPPSPYPFSIHLCPGNSFLWILSLGCLVCWLPTASNWIQPNLFFIYSILCCFLRSYFPQWLQLLLQVALLPGFSPSFS